MRKVKVAATQMSCSWNREEVLDKAEKLVRKAAAEGANIILLQELFETPYFCQKQKFEYFNLAKPLSENAAVKRFTEVAKELQVVLPISFYEKAGNTAFNTIAIIDADGTILGTGSIEEGKCANIIVLDQNLFTIDPEKIPDTRVVWNIFEGQTIYDRLNNNY